MLQGGARDVVTVILTILGRALAVRRRPREGVARTLSAGDSAPDRRGGGSARRVGVGVGVPPVASALFGDLTRLGEGETALKTLGVGEVLVRVTLVWLVILVGHGGSGSNGLRRCGNRSSRPRGWRGGLRLSRQRVYSGMELEAGCEATEAIGYMGWWQGVCQRPPTRDSPSQEKWIRGVRS